MLEDKMENFKINGFIPYRIPMLNKSSDCRGNLPVRSIVKTIRKTKDAKTNLFSFQSIGIIYHIEWKNGTHIDDLK